MSAAQFSDKTKAIATKVGLPAPMEKWLTSEQLCEIGDITLMEGIDADVELNIVTAAKAANVTCGLKDKIAVKKFWIACRDVYDTARLPDPSRLSRRCQVYVDRNSQHCVARRALDGGLNPWQNVAGRSRHPTTSLGMAR